jgi:thiamine biosynthesis protein ThiS
MAEPIQTAISIIVNGETRTARAGETISDLIRALELVKRAQWTTTVLPAGATLEIVQFVGGG